MSQIPAAIADFLAQRRIAVAGVSRQSSAPANAIFRKLRDAGYEAIPVNPAATRVEGVPCHPDVATVPGGVDAVMVVTPPAAAAAVVERCADLGIRRVWLHRSLGQGSLSAAAVAAGKRRGVRVIAGACPMMYVPPVDPFHRCLRWWRGRPPGADAPPPDPGR